ncbi:beta-galactoside-specific lectin 3-like [Momordica charantia]|uniref:Beta-galactoside-specific lectin 3-like n=1 Tax=Momordica charantia TaxID=3673 RepID=A0A6J1D675_MOMCH|nr:beta-galactoside-specific lectin 3-like [Momordica charantia]
MERMMKEMVVCIVVALSVLMSAHHAMAAYPYPRYGSFGKKSHIVGRDGLCLDIAKFEPAQVYIQTQLSLCEAAKQTQLWTILEDGTIRTKDYVYCLVPYNDAYEAKAVLGKCAELMRSVKKWNHKNDGTFVHENTGLVLTAKPDNFVVLGTDVNTPSQSWEATEGLTPSVVNIQWREGLCLQSMDNGAPFVYLNSCDKKNKNQHWALYSDGTIRVDNYGKRSDYCLTSQRNPSSVILVSNCDDKATQRWGINEENFIYHPNTNLVLDVDRKPEGSQIVVIDTRDGTPNQQWTIL